MTQICQLISFLKSLSVCQFFLQFAGFVCVPKPVLYSIFVGDGCDKNVSKFSFTWQSLM